MYIMYGRKIMKHETTIENEDKKPLLLWPPSSAKYLLQYITLNA